MTKMGDWREFLIKALGENLAGMECVTETEVARMENVA